MMGFFLGWWAIAAVPLPIPVIVSGYVLGGGVVGVALGVVKDNIWSAIAVVPAFACFFFWPKIEKLWKRDE